MDDILMFIGGALLSGLGGACIGYWMGRATHNHIQISGNNSKQIMIGNINHNKCSDYSEEESEKIFDEVWDEKDKESVDIYNAAD